MKAIPFAGIDYWFNSKPLELSMLKGNVVLLVFWTYSCVNCVREIPFLKHLWGKYKQYPFVLIGVHTPEFNFEKMKDNVKNEIERNKIDYPVALDSENITWKLYGNRYWPKQVLISADGEIVYGHIGEGAHDDIEKNIVEQLQKLGAKVDFRREMSFGSIFSFLKHRNISPETYVGSNRGSIASPMKFNEKNTAVYVDPGEHKFNSVYLDGQWKQEQQYAIHHGEKGYAAYKFHAKSVNIVADSEKNIECFITVDGKPLTKYNHGSDVVKAGEMTKITVDRPGMYNLYNSEKAETHEIMIETEGALRLFVFTFG